MAHEGYGKHYVLEKVVLFLECGSGRCVLLCLCLKEVVNETEATKEMNQSDDYECGGVKE